MSDFYTVKRIPGKGLGCFAVKNIKKGTSVLQEKPQCRASEASNGFADADFRRSVLTSYLEMSESDRREYLNLYNRFEDTEMLSDEQKKETSLIEEHFKTKSDLDPAIVAEFLKALNIYRTNSFEKGVGILVSRFNHACCSNAEAIWNEEAQVRHIRTTSNIKAGEEITIR